MEDNTATVRGGTPIKGAKVMSTDLRASVSLVMTGMIAEGTPHVLRVYHLDRGHEDFEEKLQACHRHPPGGVRRVRRAVDGGRGGGVSPVSGVGGLHL